MKDGLALPVDLSSESACRLRFSLLLAISSVRSLNGHTPKAAIDAVVTFAKGWDDTHSEVLKRRGGSRPRAGGSDRNNKQAALDRSQYYGVLLLALGNLKPEASSKTDEHVVAMEAIKELALSRLQGDWTAARTAARIAARAGVASRLPSLAMGGAVTAMSLHCLAELDAHFVSIETSSNTTLPAAPRRRHGKSAPKAQLGVGPFTGVNYAAYFLPVGSVVGRLRVDAAEISERFFASCPGVVRAAGLEAATRLLFTQHTKAFKRAKNIASDDAKQREMARVKNGDFVATALAAVLSVLHNDSDRWTRRQAATTLLNTVLDRSGRIGLLGLGLGDIGACLAWSDPSGLSAKPSKVRFPSTCLAPSSLAFAFALAFALTLLPPIFFP
jgi:hypothetical protein